MEEKTFNVEHFDQALTFDDVLLVPSYSEALPGETSLETRLTADLRLTIPFVSAAMDSVTGSATARCMAREGGIGVVHKNMSLEDQADAVRRVKRSESRIIAEPVTVDPDMTLGDALALMGAKGISGVPVVDDGCLVGMLTGRDLRFISDTAQPVRARMSTRLVTAPVGASVEDVRRILFEHRLEKLPIVDDAGRLRGLVTARDIAERPDYPNAARDENGRLLVAGAVGVGPAEVERAEALLAAGCDLLVVDTAHGHSKRVIDQVRILKATWPTCQVMAGNVATGEGTRALMEAGADAVKVGIGPGSICTTRIVAGVGVPQLSAIEMCSRVAAEFGRPIVADGGIKFSGDAAKALAAGADCVMIGNLFAGTDEAPGELIFQEGRSYKVYRGMGSMGAMRDGSKDRYGQEGARKLVPEGIEGRVPYKGPLADTVFQLAGGVRAAMGYIGARTIPELHERARFVRITPSGLAESHVHGVVITRQAPNYNR